MSHQECMCERSEDPPLLPHASRGAPSSPPAHAGGEDRRLAIPQIGGARAWRLADAIATARVASTGTSTDRPGGRAWQTRSCVDARPLGSPALDAGAPSGDACGARRQGCRTRTHRTARSNTGHERPKPEPKPRLRATSAPAIQRCKTRTCGSGWRRGRTRTIRRGPFLNRTRSPRDHGGLSKRGLRATLSWSDRRRLGSSGADSRRRLACRLHDWRSPRKRSNLGCRRWLSALLLG